MTKFNTCWIWKQHFNDYNSLEEGKVTSFKKKNTTTTKSYFHVYILTYTRTTEMCPKQFVQNVVFLSCASVLCLLICVSWVTAHPYLQGSQWPATLASTNACCSSDSCIFCCFFVVLLYLCFPICSLVISVLMFLLWFCSSA